MPASKVFWEDPYLTQLNARITGVEGDVITLDRTILYAFSGGQASDSGTISGYPVLEARKEGLEIYYRLPGGHGLMASDEVETKIDWEKRYKIMRLHFAAELVLELIYQNFNHPDKIGANITEDKARVDFFWEGNITETFPVLDLKFKELVRSDADIISGFSDRENEKRYWEIKGFAKVSCGGTHLRRTGEIGEVSFKRKNPGGGKERIEISLL